jgi:spore maturation protein CgeB
LRRKFNLSLYNQTLKRYALNFKPDLMVVTKGTNIFPATLREIKEILPCIQLMNINYDDYFSPSPSNIFPHLDEVVSLYDWIFPSKRVNVEELRKLGGGNVHYVPIGYDPRVHFPIVPDPDEYSRYFSEVLFIGTYTPERVSFLNALNEYRLSIWGGHWKRRMVGPFLQRSISRSGKNRNVGGLKLARVAASTLIGLNFFRGGNRDTHNHRTFELPACGTFTLSQRSDELYEFFEEGSEIAMFSSVEELREKVRYYLDHDREREKMALAAHERLMKGKHTIRDRVDKMMGIIEAC